jgi:hypothetical protein
VSDIRKSYVLPEYSVSFTLTVTCTVYTISTTILHSLSPAPCTQYPLLFKVLIYTRHPHSCGSFMKRNLFHSKEISTCKVYVKNVCLLANSEVLTTMLWEIQIIWKMTPGLIGNSSLLDRADSGDGSRVPIRSVDSYLPTDTASYSGGFRSTNVRI